VRGGNWRSQIKLTGGGRNWQDMNWQITAPARFRGLARTRDVMLDGLVANLVTRGRSSS
jgi:hypothetical protein